MSLLRGSSPYWVAGYYTLKAYYWSIRRPGLAQLIQLSNSSPLWDADEPNLNSNEACVALKPQNGRVIDELYSERYPVICEDTTV